MLWDLCPWVSKLRGPEGGGSHAEGIFRMRGESKYGRRGPKMGKIQRNISTTGGFSIDNITMKVKKGEMAF